MNTRYAFGLLLSGAGLLAGCGSSEPPAASVEQAAVAATAAEHAHDAPVPTPAAQAEPKVPVLEQDLAYGEGQRSNLVGYLAMPQDAAEPLPGIIVIHEWWGLNDNIKAMVMYYGQVLTDRARLAPLNVPILGFFGADDESIPVRDVREFRATLSDLGKNAEVLIVPGADHAFANPSGGNYNEPAANEAWDTTLKFLERHLKLSTPTQAQ